MKELKATQSAEEDASKTHHRTTRTSYREAKEALSAHEDAAVFNKSNQKLLQEATETAHQRASAALANLSGPINRGTVLADALERYFKVKPGREDEATVAQALQTIRDVLTVAQHSLGVAEYGDFARPESCKEDTGAYVTDLSRGATVNVCDIWVAGALPFGGTCRGAKDCRAFALLHEFCHLAGADYSGSKTCQGSNEMYVHCKNWPDVTRVEALTLADAYAAFAWAVSEGDR
jgi:hypothetical protein